MKTFQLFLFCLCGFSTFAQTSDTLRVMTYNLLYYGEVTSFCTSSNNNLNAKDGYFKTIAAYAKPDLLLVNEMAASIVYADRIIANVLNVDGETRYKRVPIQNNSFSSLVNGVFYDKNKLSLIRQEKVTTALNSSSLVRVLDICSFYYKDPNLTEGSDTIFLHLVGVHLKAGDATSDVQDRGLATEALMDYLESNYEPGNFIVAGDMNLKSSSEAAYQSLTSSSHGDYRFYDPLIPNGSWSGSSSNFAYSHTQSTHTSSGCPSGGGLDDRFDIMLMTGQIIEDTGAVNYVSDSYRAVGNDANHYNQSILDGTNSSAPSSVINALYEMSDHLPVIADLSVKLLPEISDTTDSLNGIALENRINRDRWSIDVFDQRIRVSNQSNTGVLEVRDLTGRLVMSKRISQSDTWVNLSDLRSGMYIVTGQSSVSSVSRKVFVGY